MYISFILDLQRIAKAKGRGLGRTGVLSDRKKHGYPSQNALRNTLACFLAGESTPLPPIQGGIFADNRQTIIETFEKKFEQLLSSKFQRYPPSYGIHADYTHAHLASYLQGRQRPAPHFGNMYKAVLLDADIDKSTESGNVVYYPC